MGDIRKLIGEWSFTISHAIFRRSYAFVPKSLFNHVVKILIDLNGLQVVNVPFSLTVFNSKPNSFNYYNLKGCDDDKDCST